MRALNKMCEIPSVSASCPTAAIRPAEVDGFKSVEVDEKQCMYCANCYTVCPSMPLNDPVTDGVSIWVGGKVSDARTPPKFSKLAVPYIPNNPPRWPEVVGAVKKIVELWAANARPYERIGEWIERITLASFLPDDRLRVQEGAHRRLQARGPQLQQDRGHHSCEQLIED